MQYQFATIVVTTAVAVNLRVLSQMMDRGETDGMFTVALSATGVAPATHFISTGMVPRPYVVALSDAATLESVARAAYLRESVAFPFTTTQIVNALSKCTLSDGTFSGQAESPFAMMTRLGLKVIQEAL